MNQRILISAFSAKVGGGKTYINNLLCRLPAAETEDLKKLKIYIFLPDDISLPDDPRIVRLSTSWPTNNPFARLLWENLILPVTLIKLKIDVLFCPGGIVNTPKLGNWRTVTMFRNMLPFDERILFSSKSLAEKIIGVLRKKAMLRSMAKAELVIFISNYARSVIEKLIPLKKAITIPHGISKQFLVTHKSLARPPLPFAGPYLLYVSRFEFYKRHLEVVKAYQQLPKPLQSQYKLLFVGGTDLSTGQEVIEYVKNNNLEDHVIFLGDYPYANLPSLYKNARVNIFASACENCPNILLEAMGAGVPILCSSYEPMPEFGGQTLTYMNPDSPHDICEKLTEVILKSESSDSFCEARLSQAEKFNWDSTAQKTWELLLNI